MLLGQSDLLACAERRTTTRCDQYATPGLTAVYKLQIYSPRPYAVRRYRRAAVDKIMN